MRRAAVESDGVEAGREKNLFRPLLLVDTDFDSNKERTMKKATRTGRQTFRQVYEELRGPAAHSLWRKARLASRLRHQARAAGAWASARVMSTIKVRAIRQAASVAPAG